jgi:hypothetical protein
VTERPLPLIGELASQVHRGLKTQSRRPISALNSLVYGAHDRALFARLWLAGAWVDQGPSPAGNAGPYLRATDPKNDDATHRVYSRVQPGDRFWIREPAKIIGVDELFDAERCGVRVEYDDGVKTGWFAWPSRMTWAPVVGHKIPNGCIREAARTVVTVTALRPDRVQDITEADVMAEGVTVDAAAKITGVPWSSIPTLHYAWREVWEMAYGREAWAANQWTWVYTWEAHKA